MCNLHCERWSYIYNLCTDFTKAPDGEIFEDKLLFEQYTVNRGQYKKSKKDNAGANDSTPVSPHRILGSDVC
jgi:deoxyadenosine/deoxycytidine kinase